MRGLPANSPACGRVFAQLGAGSGRCFLFLPESDFDLPSRAPSCVRPPPASGPCSCASAMADSGATVPGRSLTDDEMAEVKKEVSSEEAGREEALPPRAPGGWGNAVLGWGWGFMRGRSSLARRRVESWSRGGMWGLKAMVGNHRSWRGVALLPLLCRLWAPASLRSS